MKRALVSLFTFAMVGASACSSDSNPSPPPYLAPLDSGVDERGPAIGPDTPASSSEVARDVPYGGPKDASLELADGKGLGIDVGPPARVTVTILSLVASSPEGGPAASPDGGAGVVAVFANTDRLAPAARVVLESATGEPTTDVVVTATATLTAVGSSTPATRITLNQTDYAVVGGARVYGYSDTPFDLAKLPTDVYTLEVAVVTAGGTRAAATSMVSVDGGPAILFLNPPDGVHVTGAVAATVVVLDDRAGVTSVSFSVGQVPIKPDYIITNGAQYTVNLDFGSFNPPLDGLQVLTVTALNGNGVVAIASRRFTVDNDGPSITETKPSSGGLIGKLITIEAKVSDPAGVMESSVVAVVAHGDVHFEVHLEKGADGVYRKLFDTTQLPSYSLFPTISFRAQDILGNQSSIGYLVSLDNTPPVLDLDPPDQVRLLRTDGVCSWPFDPVGPDAIDEGSVVNQLFDVRARIEDEGNTPRTGVPDFVPIAGIDPASVKVLILDDTTQPLVVDTSDPPDEICDDVNPELVPSVAPQSSRDAQLLDLVPLAARSGSGDFSPQPGIACSGTSEPPKPLCETTYSLQKGAAMTYALGYAGSLPSIWTLAPIVADRLQCAGRQFDASNNLHDGWACVAVVAADRLGNKQVSRPIRICVASEPNSAGCSPAVHGGSSLSAVYLPSSASANVVIGTAGVVAGLGGAPVTAGETLLIANPAPGAIRGVAGEHKVTPVDDTGKQFMLTDVTATPYELWLDPLDGSAPVLKGPVGVVLQQGRAPRVVTDLPASQLPLEFNGKVALAEQGRVPAPADYVAPAELTVEGFTLSGTATKLGGLVILAAKLPNCTGTVVKSATGGSATVDPTRACRPWAAYPPVEWVAVN